MAIIKTGTVKIFTTKNGVKATIRYPEMSDLANMTSYINKISREDTFITFSGEQLSLNEEKKFLAKTLKQIKTRDKVFLCCFIQDELAGISSVERNLENRIRARHLGKFGLSVAHKYRGAGIGYILSKTTIEESTRKITGLRIIELEVYDINKIAKSLYKKLGFIEVGTMPEAIYYRGDYIGDTIMYLKL